MAKQIRIFDTTLRDGEQSPGCSMNLSEKREVARQLCKLGVDVIEAGFAIASPGDFEAISEIARVVKGSQVASLARSVQKDIDAAYNAVKHAEAPLIHIFLATSPIHMQHKLRMDPEKVLDLAVEATKYAKSFCHEVEFSCEDATRSELPFLAKVVQKVIEAGATIVNIPDTVGYTTPAEMTERITYLKQNVPDIDKIHLSVHCHNDLGMAVANSLAAVAAGATQVEGTINGIGERAGNAALEEVIMALHTRRALYDAYCKVDTTQIYRTSRLLSNIIGQPVPPNKAIVGANAFAHESGIHQHGVLAERSTYEIMTPQSIGLAANKMVLGKHSGRHAVEDRLKELGYTLTKKELDNLFERFKKLADQKKNISDSDLEALAADRQIEQPGAYKLERYVVNCGKCMTATAVIGLAKDGEVTEGVAAGTGPVDAAYKAIESIVGPDFTLTHYAIQSVSEGEDSLGEVVVRLKKGENVVTGRGLSTDIIESSLLAYINGINKLLKQA
jgi:2-isopropylmalate synthase